MVSVQCDYSTLSTSYSNGDYGPGNFVYGLIENIDEEEVTSSEGSDKQSSEPLPKRRVPPKDRFNFVYLVFGLIGVGTLLPWNFFITANDFWMYKFRNVSSGSVGDDSQYRTPLQALFTSYIALAMNISYVVFLIICTIFHESIGRLRYIIISLVITIALFVGITALVKINTDEWENLYFLIIMIAVVLLGIFSAVLQAASMGISSVLPPKYIHIMVLGMALAGILATFSQILSLVSHSDPVESAFGYFFTADVILLATLLGYLGIQKSEFFQYYLHCSEDPQALQEVSSSNVKIRIPFWIVLKRVWSYGVSIMLAFVVTLGIFPGLAVLVAPVNPSTSIWTGRLFLPLTCFTLFNCGDFFGRALGGLVEGERHSYRRRLLGFSIVRMVFIPLFLLCNAHPRYNLPVIFGDVSYIAFISLMGFTNGFLVTVSLICGTKCVNMELQETAGIILSTFLGLGLMFGSLLSYILIKII